MASMDNHESGFTEKDIEFARQTFFRDCPNGRCSKEKFLTFIRQSQKPVELNIHLIKIIQNYRQNKKFFSMMFDIYDRNHDGELDFDEYLYALSAISGANRLRTIETLFNFFDIHNRGYITREDFNVRKKLAAKFLGHYKTGVKDTSIYDQAFNEMDCDKDGQISKDDFIQWHFDDHLLQEESKPLSRRSRLLRNLSTLVDIRGQIKTSSLQTELPDPSMGRNTNNQQDLTSTAHADRYLLKIFRRARNRFHHEKINYRDNQSDSGAFTASAATTYTEDDSDSDSLFDIDENEFETLPNDQVDNELMCQSLEAALMETLLELREHRKRINNNQLNNSILEDQQSLRTRL